MHNNDIFNSINDVTEYCKSLQKDLEENNRFFPDNKLRIMLENILSLKNAIKFYEVGHKFYRGRIYVKEKDTNINKPAEFKGYDFDGSTVNLNNGWVSEGRMNPDGIRVLYVATGEKTCAKELGAAAGETISIAVMTVKERIKIADFVGATKRLKNKKKKEFVQYINHILSSGYGDRTYIFPQYISMLCKSLGFDGIMYRSKYANKNDIQTGLNVALFYHKKCEPTESYLKVIKKSSLEFEK